jgi:hypothetical protein
MKRTVSLMIVMAIILILLGRAGYREYWLRRDEAAVTRVLSTHTSQYGDVRIYRSKSDYNLLEGQVAGSNDLQSLKQELARLHVRRCIFAVRVADTPAK